jgi:UDP-N-acetylglucosamine 4,6-dehydratase
MGNIDDAFTIQKTMGQSVYHLAALKGVDTAEREPRQCIKSNIVGTLNILEQSLITKPEFVIGISTDKAAQVVGVYGASKLCMERLYMEYSMINPDTKYRIVRFGNVLGSTSSFLTKWIPKLKRGEEIQITDPSMTRFFWTVKSAVNHIEDCLKFSVDATPYIPQMKGVSMGVVLQACMDVYGLATVKVIGNRNNSENFHETMNGIDFSNQVEQWTKEEFIREFLSECKSDKV